MSEFIVGTFCGVINKQILVAVCPLRRGACMWQHRATHACRYTADEMTPQEFARLVGAPVPEEHQVEALKIQLASAVRTSRDELRG